MDRKETRTAGKRGVRGTLHETRFPLALRTGLVLVTLAYLFFGGLATNDSFHYCVLEKEGKKVLLD